MARRRRIFSGWAERRPSRPSPTAPKPSRGRPHRRTRQHLCRRREETDRGRNRHRLHRRPHRNRHHRRRRRSALDRRRYAGASRARRRRVGDPAHHVANLAEAVAAEIERQLATLPTAAVARPSIDTNGAIVMVDSLDQAVEIRTRSRRNIWLCTTRSLLAKIHHAGASSRPGVPEAAGDYASGPITCFPLPARPACAAASPRPISSK